MQIPSVHAKISAQDTTPLHGSSLKSGLDPVDDLKASKRDAIGWTRDPFVLT